MKKRKDYHLKHNKKGFTLVELIVVLVVLAILAAILIPALLGYIDRARGSDVLVEAKYALTDAQAAIVEVYGKDPDAFKFYYEVAHTGGKNQGYIDDDGVFHASSVITQSSLSTMQQVYRQQGGEEGVKKHLQKYYDEYEAGDKNKAFSYCAHSISTQILRQMNSLDSKTGEYKFFCNDRCSNMTYDDFYAKFGSNAEKSNPVIYQIYFDDRGKILMLEYGKNGYLVRIENGEATVEKNGKTYRSK